MPKSWAEPRFFAVRGFQCKISSIYLDGGDNLDIFLDDFPTISHARAIGVLELFSVRLLEEHEVAA